jgi:hypothetical protein
MAAMVIMTIAMSVAFEAFSATIRGWRRGSEVVEGLQQGDYAMTHFVSALNSTVYFNNPRSTYAFIMERDVVNGLPADSISFVTASSAFMPINSPLRNGPHRIELFIDMDENGDPALFSLAFPAVANLDDVKDEFDAEPHLVSRAVQGLEVLLYDDEIEDWTDADWDKANSVPARIRLTVFIASAEEDEEPITFTRIFEIPVADSVRVALTSPTKAATGGGR